MSSACQRLSAQLACLLLALSFLGGCATSGNPRDPFEPVNRGIYEFNERIDNTLLKPAAQAYRFVIPQFVRSSVSNFFANINDVVVALNNLLQGKFTAAYTDLGRVAINSTLGVLGLFDVATEAGIEKHDEDFGQTLGYWGVGDGPFLVLPIFGPSTARDTVGRFADYKADLVTYVDPSRSRNQLWATRAVNRRAELLDASTVLQTAALDPYEFVRDAYLQRRRALIYDGAPPPDREFMDPPPAPKTTLKPASTFPASAEATGAGSILVSGEARVPVQSALGALPASSAAASNIAAPVRKAGGLIRETPSWSSGEPLTPAQLEMLEQGRPIVRAFPVQDKASQPALLVRALSSEKQ
jgi:phospholipid-binding lipoprotein MlaA